MIGFALVFLAAGAVGGAIMAIVHLRGSNPPLPLAIIHGIATVAGVGVVIVAILLGFGTPRSTTALGLFVVAALGGLYLFSLHLRGKRLVTPVVLIHGVVAVAGLLVLLVGALESLR
jgi:hypothetical protein